MLDVLMTVVSMAWPLTIAMAVVMVCAVTVKSARNNPNLPTLNQL